MCGIAGLVYFDGLPTNITQLLVKMGDTIAHRGPDAHGEYSTGPVGLCHRRLSIIDLSESGNQPMVSSTDKTVIVFNGEIYNFLPLREQLLNEGYQFKTKTDTEVILALYEKHGTQCLQYLNGMFAFAIWDKLKNELFVARDRLGKKPLYFHQSENRFVFGSEIKAILQVPGISKELRNDAIYDFFTYQYVPDPKTIFQSIQKLEPGHYLLINNKGATKHQYWNVSFSSTQSKSEEQICSELFDLISDSVKERMVSDVPLGAFLSGGIDSSAVVGLMASQQEQPITTCSIGFDSKKFDEVTYAKMVAEKFSTNHFEFTVKDNVAQQIAPIAQYFDEPFADPSLIPTYFVSKLARQKVTVALAGDGGDESFAGYQKYSVDQLENRLRGKFPASLRKTLFPMLADIFSHGDHTLFRKATSILTTLSASKSYGFYMTNAFLSDRIWNQVALPELKNDLAGYHPSNITEKHYSDADTENHLSKILYTDIKTYLPGDILVKVDRMSMANSLEVRAPLLDHKVVEYAAGIPASLKLNGTEKKYILKKTFESLLPNDILYRKKMGFSVPLAQWLRHDIKDFAEQTLFGPNSGIANYFDINQIKQLWESHQTGKRAYSNELWSFLMFEIWWQRYI